MASAVWLGKSFHDKELLQKLLELPVREWVLPWEDFTAERLLEPGFEGKAAPCVTAGERHLWHLPFMTEQDVRQLAVFDLYFLGTEDFTPARVIFAGEHKKLLALGEHEPPAPCRFKKTPSEELLPALGRALPFPHPAAFYLSGETVSASIEDEDFSRLLERLGDE